METQQVREHTQRFIDALHALEASSAEEREQQVAQMAALFSAEAELVNAALKLAGETRRGPEGARRFWSEYRRTFGTARSEFFQITINAQAAGLFWTTRGTGNDGQPLEYDGASLLVFDEAGQIRLFRGYYDTREAGRAVGVEHQPHRQAQR
ncbi:nuclear transport factor 2 family protein [Kallotenue papyrolyticum]|uniref:nuclear transport factor 2 family protein n=1 Tax=Kallotenue papyrolyticum TaxID=1325125 RepID=UPI0004724953|nr:nuclear transport factor 2 family protein [Kallotenue papyrolyticum]